MIQNAESKYLSGMSLMVLFMMAGPSHCPTVKAYGLNRRPPRPFFEVPIWHLKVVDDVRVEPECHLLLEMPGEGLPPFSYLSHGLLSLRL